MTEWEKISEKALGYLKDLARHGKDLSDTLMVTEAWATVCFLTKWFPAKINEFADQKNTLKWVYDGVGGFLEKSDREREAIWGTGKREADILEEKYLKRKDAPGRETLRVIWEYIPGLEIGEDILSLVAALNGYDFLSKTHMDSWERVVQGLTNIPIISDVIPLPTRAIDFIGDLTRIAVREWIYKRKWPGNTGHI